jgi:hypothetical protein
MNAFSKNTYKYFWIVQQHRKGLREIDSRYQPRLDALEKHRGSDYYESERKRLTAMREREVDALREDSISRLDEACDDMWKTYSSKPAPTPTPEQLALVQALKMRKPGSVPREELQQAALAVKGVPALEKVLTEMSVENGGSQVFAPTISSDKIQTTIHNLRLSGGRMIHQLEHCDERGKYVNTSNWDMFRVDTDVQDEADALRVYGLVTGATAEEFSNAVNPAEK